MKKKVFPSTIKYRENNPAISFRLKKADKEKLYTIIQGTGKPLSKWITDFINEGMNPNGETSKLVKKIQKLEEEKNELEIEHRFQVTCSHCNEVLVFSSNESNFASEVYPILEQAFSKWHSRLCKPK